MRILVVSDSHGHFHRFNQVIEKHPDAEYIFFLGDGKKELDDICDLYPEKSIFAVKGNCDFLSPLPSVRMADTELGKILYTHGDIYFVKHGTERLIEAGKEKNARLVLYGHTHQKDARYIDGMYVFNPGSLGAEGSYGVCDILESGIILNHLTI